MFSSSLASIFALAIVSLAGASNRVIDFKGGRTSVDALGEVDHVLVQDLRGDVISDSLCDRGRFSDYFVLFIRFRDAVMAGDKEAAVRLIHYPFQVNAPERQSFRNAKALTKSYDQVFTAEIIQKIRDAEPAAVFCKNGYATLGAGVVWANRTGIAILDTLPTAGGIPKIEPPHARDLVMRAQVVSFKMTNDDPQNPWLVTVAIKRMISGESPGKTFQFAVHNPWESGLKKRGTYTVEAIWNGSGYDVDPLQWRKRMSEQAAASAP